MNQDLHAVVDSLQEQLATVHNLFAQHKSFQASSGLFDFWKYYHVQFMCNTKIQLT